MTDYAHIERLERACGYDWSAFEDEAEEQRKREAGTDERQAMAAVALMAVPTIIAILVAVVCSVLSGAS